MFAREGRVLEGTLPVSAFERLHDLLADVSGDVSFRIEGYKSDHGELMLQVVIGGVLLLACQRCLKAVSFDPAVPENIRDLLFDPQTSGGLLISIPAGQADALLADMKESGVEYAACIGRVRGKGTGKIHVR